MKTECSWWSRVGAFASTIRGTPLSTLSYIFSPFITIIGQEFMWKKDVRQKKQGFQTWAPVGPLTVKKKIVLWTHVKYLLDITVCVCQRVFSLFLFSSFCCFSWRKCSMWKRFSHLAHTTSKTMVKYSLFFRSRNIACFFAQDSYVCI